MTLSSSERDVLLRAARDAIAAELDHREPVVDPRERAGELARPRGCFVTLRREDGDLRGCTGTLEPSVPLADEVRAMAVAAATRDPRFAPLSSAELDGLHLDISALTVPHVIRGPDDVAVGKHGLIVERGARRGVLLPQVATGHGLDALRFVEATCEKAGLERDAWRDPETRLSAFEAEVF